MNVLMLSGDKKILSTESAFRSRVLSYAKRVDSITIFVKGIKNEYPTQNQSVSLPIGLKKNTYSLFKATGKEIILCDNAKVIVSGTNNKFLSYINILIKSLFFLYFEHSKRKNYIITAQDPFLYGFVAILLSRIYNVPTEIQVHTDINRATNGFRKWVMFFARYSLSRANSIRAVSQKVKECIILINPLFESKTYILPIAITKFEPMLSSFKKKEKIILIVSRLEKEKNIQYAIRFFRSILDRTDGVSLRIAGDGSMRKKLEQLTYKYGVSDKVRFLGHVDNIASEYSKATFLLHTAEFEGFGMVFIEAGLCALPIVSTDVGIAREVGAVIINKDNLVSGEILLLLTDERTWQKKSSEIQAKVELFKMKEEDYSEKIVENWKRTLKRR